MLFAKDLPQTLAAAFIPSDSQGDLIERALTRVGDCAKNPWHAVLGHLHRHTAELEGGRNVGPTRRALAHNGFGPRQFSAIDSLHLSSPGRVQLVKLREQLAISRHSPVKITLIIQRYCFTVLVNNMVARSQRGEYPPPMMLLRQHYLIVVGKLGIVAGVKRAYRVFATNMIGAGGSVERALP